MFVTKTKYPAKTSRKYFHGLIIALKESATEKYLSIIVLKYSTIYNVRL